jgi:hypothetical protein
VAKVVATIADLTAHCLFTSTIDFGVDAPAEMPNPIKPGPGPKWRAAFAIGIALLTLLCFAGGDYFIGLMCLVCAVVVFLQR